MTRIRPQMARNERPRASSNAQRDGSPRGKRMKEKARTKAGGPIIGQRSGVTRDLDWRARAAFREAWAAAKTTMPAYPVRHMISQNPGR